jgi:tetratricopeptide (TPR) repeat protein
MTTSSQTMNEQTWAKNFSAGIAALDAGRFKKATIDLESAVEIAGQLGLTEPLTNSLLALGDAHRLAGHYQKAEETFRQAVDFSFKHPEGKRISYAFSLGALGRLYIEQDRIDQARDLLEMAVSMLRHHRASAEPEFLTVFLALITCYLEQQEFEKADKLSRYTYDLSKALVGPADAATVMAMTMCAASAKALGKQRRADILHCQIRTIMHDQRKKGASDELGIAASMLRQLNREGVVDTRPIVFDFGGEEFVFERDIPSFGDSSTSKSKKNRVEVGPKPRLRVLRD